MKQGKRGNAMTQEMEKKLVDMLYSDYPNVGSVWETIHGNHKKVIVLGIGTNGDCKPSVLFVHEGNLTNRYAEVLSWFVQVYRRCDSPQSKPVPPAPRAPSRLFRKNDIVRVGGDLYTVTADQHGNALNTNHVYLSGDGPYTSANPAYTKLVLAAPVPSAALGPQTTRLFKMGDLVTVSGHRYVVTHDQKIAYLHVRIKGHHTGITSAFSAYVRLVEPVAEVEQKKQERQPKEGEIWLCNKTGTEREVLEIGTYYVQVAHVGRRCEDPYQVAHKVFVRWYTFNRVKPVVQEKQPKVGEIWTKNLDGIERIVLSVDDMEVQVAKLGDVSTYTLATYHFVQWYTFKQVKPVVQEKQPKVGEIWIGGPTGLEFTVRRTTVDTVELDGHVVELPTFLRYYSYVGRSW